MTFLGLNRTHLDANGCTGGSKKVENGQIRRSNYTGVLISTQLWGLEGIKWDDFGCKEHG